MATIQGYQVVLRERKVEIPEECPACKADLHEESAMRALYLSDVMYHVELDKEGELTMNEGSYQIGDQYLLVGLECTECEHVFLDGTFQHEKEG